MSRQLATESSLTKYLQGNILVEDYFSVVRQILDTLIKVQNGGMQIQLSIQTMRVCNKKVLFQMTAEDSIYELSNVKDFLKNLTFSCVFSGNQNFQKITSFMHFLDDGASSSSLGKIYEFFEERPRVEVQKPIAEPEETGVLDGGFWEQFEQRQTVQPVRNIPEDAGETGVLDPAYWGDAVQESAAILVNTKTKKVVSIAKDTFWIGKEAVDLQINKDTISRKHAVITKRNGHYFIMDNNSTNKTYVDNHEIPAKGSVEIFDGNRIKFADEEYEFQM